MKETQEEHTAWVFAASYIVGIPSGTSTDRRDLQT